MQGLLFQQRGALRGALHGLFAVFHFGGAPFAGGDLEKARREQQIDQSEEDQHHRGEDQEGADMARSGQTHLIQGIQGMFNGAAHGLAVD